MKGKLGGYPFSGGVKIEERDCEAIHKARIEAENRKDFDDDEIMKELEEERKRREEQEGDEKRKKKKKKSKKNDDL